jgi:polyisoprenoid-binding protein YceI
MASALLRAPAAQAAEGGGMHRRFGLALLLLTAVAGQALAQTTWEIDPAHSAVQFSIRHMMISNVRGEFGTFSGTARADEKDLTKSVVEATIDTASIDTRNAKRDEHLRSPDFLEVAKFPKMTFKSKRIEPVGSGRWKVTGDLTLHGVTREVVLDVEGPSAEVRDPGGKTRAGAHVTTTLKRSDFGITWSKMLDGGGVMVGDDVAVTIDVEGVKQ